MSSSNISSKSPSSPSVGSNSSKTSSPWLSLTISPEPTPASETAVNPIPSSVIVAEPVTVINIVGTSVGNSIWPLTCSATVILGGVKNSISSIFADVVLMSTKPVSLTLYVSWNSSGTSMTRGSSSPNIINLPTPFDTFDVTCIVTFSFLAFGLFGSA